MACSVVVVIVLLSMPQLSAELPPESSTILEIFGGSAYGAAMPPPATSTETLLHLLAARYPRSRSDLCTASGLSARAIADLLAGRVATPHRSTVAALAGALRVSRSRVAAAIAASRAAADR
jgi:hypothetical protein